MLLPSLSKEPHLLIDYIRSGVITGIEVTSGMQGRTGGGHLQECIPPKPVVFKTHGGRVRSIEQESGN